MRARLAIGTFALSLAVCGSSDPSMRAWLAAEAAWRARDPEAFRLWTALDPASPSGAAAHARLALARARFGAGIDRLTAGDSGARDEFLAAQALAPMDPALYLPLARACRTRGSTERAAEFFRKFIRYAPQDPEVAQAKRELGALDEESLEHAFENPAEPPALRRFVFGGTVGLLMVAVGGGFFLFGWARRQRRSLAQLAADRPEFQPAITFLVGCLRHELFKHRILPVADALAALLRGEASPGQREFLLARLFGGEPLPLAWVGHLGAFIRTLGPRFDLLRSDPAFREAGRAIAEIASLRSVFAKDERQALLRLSRAHARLSAFDGELGALCIRLTHTRIDGALLNEVIGAVGGEFPDSGVEMALQGPIPDALFVEIYRFDLLLVPCPRDNDP